MTINEYLRYLRQKHHYTQEYVAKCIGVKTETISKIEQGKTRYPQLYTLIGLENLYNLEPDTLTEWQDKDIN